MEGHGSVGLVLRRGKRCSEGKKRAFWYGGGLCWFSCVVGGMI